MRGIFRLCVIALLCAISPVGVAHASTWSAVQTLSPATSTSDDAVTVVDRFGTATTAWQQRITGGNVVWVSRTGPNGWSTPLQVSTVATIYATRPRLAVAPNGDVRLVWEETGSASYLDYRYVRARTYSKATDSWGAMQTILDGTGGIDPTPEVAVGPDGVAYIAYLKSVSGVAAPRVVMDTGSGWGSAEQLTATWASNLRIAAPSAGRPVVLWFDSSATMASRRNDSGWSTPTSIYAPTGSFTNFTIGVGGGQVSVVWNGLYSYCSGGGGMYGPPPSCFTSKYVWTARYDPSTAAWSGLAVSVGVGTASQSGTLATGADGTDVVAWVDGGALKVRTRAADGTWATAQQVADASSGVDVPAAGVDALGTPLVAWRSGSSAPYSPKVARYVDGQWTTPTAFLTGDQYFGFVLASGGTAEAPVTALQWRADPVSQVRPVYVAQLVSAPARPTQITLAAADTGSLTVGFAAPESDGGAAIASYRATCQSSDGGPTGTQTGATSPLTVTGLGGGKTYTCVVAASNAEGWSADSAASSPLAVAAAQAGSGASSTADESATPSSSSVGGPASTITSPAQRGVQKLRFDAAPSPLLGTDGSGTVAPRALHSKVVVPGPGSLQQEAIATRIGRRAPRATMRVCRTTAAVRRAGRVALTCTLSPAARRLLRQRSIVARVTTVFVGTDGTRARSLRTVVLSRMAATPGAVAVSG